MSAPGTTAGTHHGPSLTLQGIRQALLEIQRLQDLEARCGAPMRLTIGEVAQMAELLGLQTRRPDGSTEDQRTELFGIPVVIVADNSPVAQFFSLRERILRTNRLLQIPPHPAPPYFRKEFPGDWP